MRVLSWDSSLRMLYMNYVKDVILQDPRERKFRMDLKNRAVAMK